jgi:hypothetical protein
MHRELKVWLRLKHPTIVPLLGIANVDSPFPALISQWMPSGTLYIYLNEATLTPSAKVGLVSRSFTLIALNKHSSILTLLGEGRR